MTGAKLNVAVVLSGCGVFDGSEIHEAVLTLLALNRQGADYQCYAPDMDQHHVINHQNGEEMDETRNVLTEAARIARGDVKDLKELNAAAAAAVIFPGGFGAAKNLCSFAFDGPDCSVNKEVARVVGDFHAAGKPIGALCIAPAMMAKLVRGAEVTIGQDPAAAQAIEKMGAVHSKTNPCEVVVDAANKLVTAPCYMLDSTISQIADGAGNAVKELLALA
ncbi:MAG TPA: isoprenoid biosynthesis glyoxalase ElbB [Rhodospirillales bacterium]|nr:isoprenoid biosynthesis glyoxalase ElbB [Rhodospirillales bacterium]